MEHHSRDHGHKDKFTSNSEANALLSIWLERILYHDAIIDFVKILMQQGIRTGPKAKSDPILSLPCN